MKYGICGTVRTYRKPVIARIKSSQVANKSKCVVSKKLKIDCVVGSNKKKLIEVYYTQK